MEKVGMVCDLRTCSLKLVDFVGCFGAKVCNAVACGARNVHLSISKLCKLVENVTFITFACSVAAHYEQR